MKFKSWTLWFRNNQQIASETSLTSHYCYCWNVLSKDPSGSQKQSSREKQNCVFFCFILLSKINERKKKNYSEKVMWCQCTWDEKRGWFAWLNIFIFNQENATSPMMWIQTFFFLIIRFYIDLSLFVFFFPNYIFDVCISVFYRMHLSCARSLIFKHIYTLCTYASPYSN